MDTRLDTVATHESCSPDAILMASEEGVAGHHLAEGVGFAIVDWLVGGRRSTKRQSLVRLYVMARALGVPTPLAHQREIADAVNVHKSIVTDAKHSMQLRFPGFGGRSPK